MSALVENVSTDEQLRALYLRDPVGVIKRSVFGDQDVPATELSRGNRLLYALLSNQRFLDWAESYEKSIVDRATEATKIDDPRSALSAYLTIVDRAKIHADLVGAAAEFADAEFVAAITWRPDVGRPPIDADVAVDVETFVYAVAAVAVFAVAVAAVVIGATTDVSKEILNRADVLAASRTLAAELTATSAQIRESGKLLDFNRRNIGFIR